MKKIAFIDRDGTLIFEPEDTRQIDALENLKILPGVFAGLRRLQKKGYKLIMVTNQDGLGTAAFPQENFNLVQKKLLAELKKEKIEFSDILVCPHGPDINCSCRKPKTGLVKNMNWESAIMVGDRISDKEFAENLGIAFIKADTNGFFPRFSFLSRETNETKIKIKVNLDGSGQNKIKTGLRFFDHMLAQFSQNSLIDIFISAQGDLQIDEHHIIEDVGICLGKAIKDALAEKTDLQRYGFLLPMDESLAQIAIDLGGRSYLMIDYDPRREYAGDMPTELVTDFFQAFCNSCDCTINIKVSGRNEHHKIEALFKAFGQAMKMAVSREPRLNGRLPTTKGKL